MFIDSHAHLDMRAFDGDLAEVIGRAAKGGLSHIITVGIDLDSTRRALDIAKAYKMVFASTGYHPHNADRCDDAHWDELVSLASEPEIVAWGEIGLDFFRRYASPEAQTAIFRRQLEIARDLNLPSIIHDREAHDEVLRILREMGSRERNGVIHCFSGDLALAREFMDLGYHISIPGTVTYKQAILAREVASKLPLDHLLIETDCPFLSPIPKRGKRNEPLFVIYTAQEIARLRKTDPEVIAMATSKNAKALFNLG